MDFYCANNNVVIEIDGSSHDAKVEYDAQRDAYLCGLGLRVIHLDDAAVKRNLAGVMTMLRNHPIFIGNCGGNNHPAACGGTPPMEGNDKINTRQE